MLDSAPVLTLRDLDHWSSAGTSLAVLGQPIKHSISPALHHAALAKMAEQDPRYGAWQYFRFEVAPADLPKALALLHEKQFRGLNLTVPHKVLAVDYLAAIDPAARKIGAVNTLLWTERGWFGHNTDGYGLATGLKEDLQQSLTGSSIILLGAGGAARGAAVECLRQKCASLWIANRTPENLASLLEDLQTCAEGIPVRGFAPHEPPTDLPEHAIVINATSAGLRESDALPIDLRAIPKPAGVYDMIYNPPKTPLLRAAESMSIRSSNGLSMLVHQGAKALSIWSGATVPVDAMQRAARAALMKP